MVEATSLSSYIPRWTSLEFRCTSPRMIGWFVDPSASRWRPEAPIKTRDDIVLSERSIHHRGDLSLRVLANQHEQKGRREFQFSNYTSARPLREKNASSLKSIFYISIFYISSLKFILNYNHIFWQSIDLALKWYKYFFYNYATQNFAKSLKKAWKSRSYILIYTHKIIFFINNIRYSSDFTEFKFNCNQKSQKRRTHWPWNVPYKSVNRYLRRIKDTCHQFNIIYFIWHVILRYYVIEMKTLYWQPNRILRCDASYFLYLCDILILW